MLAKLAKKPGADPIRRACCAINRYGGVLALASRAMIKKIAWGRHCRLPFVMSFAHNNLSEPATDHVVVLGG
jgi:hypothetical protein